MWGNIAGVMGKALETAQKLQSELENQMDAAVGAPSDSKEVKASPSFVEPIVETSTVSEPIRSLVSPPNPALTGDFEDSPVSSPLAVQTPVSQKSEPTPSKAKKINKKKTKSSTDEINDATEPTQEANTAVPVN